MSTTNATLDVAEVVTAVRTADLEQFIRAAVILAIGIPVILLVIRLARRLMKRLPESNRAMSGFFLSLVKAVLSIVLIMTVMEVLGIPSSSLLALLSVFILAISLSLQTLIGNLLAGITILSTRPFEVGDYVETPACSGIVEGIYLLYTHLLTFDNILIMVPNSQLSSDRITNYTRQGSRRCVIPVTLGYEYEVEKVIASLLRAAKAPAPGLLAPDREPDVAVLKYAEGGVNYELHVWARTANYWPVYQTVMKAVPSVLAEDGIRLTYPLTAVRMVDGRAV